MAQELDDGEFWLPSDFLTDEDLLMDFKPVNSRTKRSGDFSTHGFGNSFWLNLDMSSPVESVNGSTETESDEDEFVTGLTRKMAHSTLQDSRMSSYFTSKGLELSASPQSTLCGCRHGSSRGSPDSLSRVSSPPLPAGKDGGWDLISAAAGEVTRRRLIEDTTPFHSTKPFAPPQKPSSVSGGCPSQTHAQAQQLAYLQLQASQRMEQQQMMNCGVWGQGKIERQFQGGNTAGGPRSQALSMAAWPTLQQSQQQQELLQQSGSGMRAVFLGGTATKKERTGTGVFLPRRFGNGSNTSEPRERPGSSTALLPDRVVHALNLNLDSSDNRQSYFRGGHGNFPSDYGASLNNNTVKKIMAERSSYMPPQRVMHQEFRLPQEWTY